MRYFKILACKIFQRELAQVLLTCPNALDITFMRQDLHTNENRFGDIEAILLGYGLCSNALAGIKSSRLPLVIPRAHDCITHFMGSKEAYADYFEKVKGTFFYNQSWLDLGLELG